MTKRHANWSRVMWAVAVIAIVLAVLRFLPSGNVMYSPGVTGDLSHMVSVKHGHRPGPGRLLMVAISVSSVSELGYLVNHFNPNVEFQSMKLALGGLNMNQYVRLNVDMMSQSKWAAEVAGEHLAGLPAHVVTEPGALVTAVLKNSTAIHKIRPGDLITAIGPYHVTSYQNLRSTMKHFKVGDIVNVTLTRKGQSLVVPVKTIKLAHDHSPAIGIGVSALQRPVIPRPVAIKSQGIGGPSAGMMFALEIYDQITGKDLAHGDIVAGTGEILPNGHVEMIGGVGQKVVTVYRAGARIFLCPVGNYPKAMAMVKRKGYHMKVFPVATLSQALHDIQSATS